jgi:hypothetical protein
MTTIVSEKHIKTILQQIQMSQCYENKLTVNLKDVEDALPDR